MPRRTAPATTQRGVRAPLSPPAAGAFDRTETAMDIPRTWVEFTDPAEAGQRFRCDLTWLTSDYHCIFGGGCLGIDTQRPDDGCCVLGAHFTDADDLARVRAVAEALRPEEWQLREAAAGPEGWWEEVAEDSTGGETAAAAASEVKTRVVDGACIFLNRAGFPGGAGCALHRHALVEGTPPHTAKPDVCWQLPIRRAYRTVRLPDETEYLEVEIGEYDRRGWGPGGHDLDWYCTGSPLAHGGRLPLYRSSAAELVELMGQAAYDELVRHCEAHVAAADAAGGRALLPLHPATALARDAAQRRPRRGGRSRDEGP